jgi:hypothetical protein
MFCRHCGKELGKGSPKFCKFCGKTLGLNSHESHEENLLKNKPHPWRRYFAKMLDLWIVGLSVGFLLEILMPGFLEGVDDAVIGILVGVLILPYEAIALPSWKRTIGKWLMGISVVKTNGNNLAPKEALYRSWLVFYRGLGLSIPIISLFTLIHQYGVLTKKGITTWDKEVGCEVKYEKLDPFKVILALILIGLFSYLVILGSDV